MTVENQQLIDEEFLRVLACPACRGGLVHAEADSLACLACANTFPILDGIPILLAERAESLAQIQNQRAIFDPQFRGYERYHLENWRRSYLRRLEEQLRLVTGATDWYVDVGAGGSGYTVIEAARMGYRAIGCDLSWEGVKKAAAFAREQGLSDRARFIVCSAEALPLKEKTFAAACSIAVLEHLVRDDLAVAELGRVLKPAGRVFVTVPHTFLRTNLAFWLPYWLHDRAHGHLRHYTARGLKKLFEQSFVDAKAFFTGRTTKAVQMLAERVGVGGDALWWKLERLDLANIESPWGAQLHLSASRRADGG